ncbi:hypothetical protein [Bifidobacterium catulorum]|uniref:hypothetical protein n=1 Tax=Bifidobacterium catulorum TaxID=1630173 RepID=UPI0011B24678|nr:hypothetical protein [Bifidobacterium catulorum]
MRDETGAKRYHPANSGNAGDILFRGVGCVRGPLLLIGCWGWILGDVDVGVIDTSDDADAAESVHGEYSERRD